MRTCTSTSLTQTARSLLACGKGILAADESFPTIGKRFAALDISSTEESRSAYREMLFTTQGIGEYVSGAILFDETIHQKTAMGTTMPELLARQGIIPGIKVDGGTLSMPGFPAERITEGLDCLRERLAGYRELGARFTKWRATFKVGIGTPSAANLRSNARSLALFASLSQEAGLVPIVEPEVLMEGGHNLERSEEVATAVLRAVFETLFEHHVSFEEMLLKTGMVVPGSEEAMQADVEAVADATVRCLLRSVPASVPGIVFLSGGQSEIQATERLNAICHLGDTPWTLSFSFGRALQDSVMKAWKGLTANVSAAQLVLLHRAQCNSLALQGKYSAGFERRPKTHADYVRQEGNHHETQY